MSDTVDKAEAEHLSELGVNNPTELLTVDPRCLVTTVWHRTLNRLREMSRGEDRHGSCGLGIGEARAYWLEHGADVARRHDWSRVAHAHLPVYEAMREPLDA